MRETSFDAVLLSGREDYKYLELFTTTTTTTNDDDNDDDDDDNSNNNNDDDDDDDDDDDNIFYNLLTAPRTVSNTYTQVARAQSCANHVQHTDRSSRATCRVPLGTKGQLSYQVLQS